jgi:hypothetical protein
VFADLIEGLLSDLGRKNGWTMAGRAGLPPRTGSRSSWARRPGARTDCWPRCRRTWHGSWGDPGATLVLDDTQVIKKGDKSAGVAHQHCGTTGDVRNCQVMVMLTYAAAHGHTFFDRRLYLPESWTSDRERCRAAGVPDEVVFATKPRLGMAMLAGAVAGGLPFSWVSADADYGKDPALRSRLHDQQIRYVLAVPVTLPVQGPPGKPRLPKVAAAGDLLHYATVREQWERRSQGEGSKGQRSYDWAWFEVILPGQKPADGFAHPLLIRRSTEKKQLADGRVDFEYVLPRPRPRHRPGHRGDRESRSPLEDRGEQRACQADHRARPVPGPPLDLLAPARDLRDARRAPFRFGLHSPSTSPVRYAADLGFPTQGGSLFGLGLLVRGRLPERCALRPGASFFGKNRVRQTERDILEVWQPEKSPSPCRKSWWNRSKSASTRAGCPATSQPPPPIRTQWTVCASWPNASKKSTAP